jgi:hypothetical protein
MIKTTYIIGGEFNNSHHFDLQTTVESIKQDPVSFMDFRVLPFLPCLHSLADDIRGFFLAGTAQLTQPVGDVVSSTGGSRQGTTWGYVSERGDRWQGKHHKSE